MNEPIMSPIDRARNDGHEYAMVAADHIEIQSLEDARAIVEDVDPEVLDRYLGSGVLSGEWAGSPTPQSLADEYGLDRNSEELDAVCTVFEEAYDGTFQEALDSAAHAYIEEHGQVRYRILAETVEYDESGELTEGSYGLYDELNEYVPMDGIVGEEAAALLEEHTRTTFDIGGQLSALAPFDHVERRDDGAILYLADIGLVDPGRPYIRAIWVSDPDIQV